MAFLKQSEVKSLPEVELEKLFEFCRKREHARITGTSDDPIISKARFCNIYREDDKVSKCLWDYYVGKQGFDLWKHILTGRILNRVDVIDEVFPLPEFGEQKHITSVLGNLDVLVNSHAYQLHPGIGRPHGFTEVKKFIRAAHFDACTVPTWEVIRDWKGTLNDLTIALNKAHGGAALFYMFQCALDYGQITNADWLNTEPFHGAGAQIRGASLQDVCEAQRIMWPDAKRPFMLFDAEHALCEFRKYSTWMINGIAKARRREK